MTISSQNRKAGPFVGNDSTTAFPFAFKVFTAADLYVVLTDTTLSTDTVLVLNTDYTVSLNANQNSNPGGTVTLPSALAEDFNLTITSSLQYLQPTDLTNQGGFYPSVITNALDRLTIFCQQLYDAVNRSLKISVSTPAGVSTTLPPPASNKLIGWNEAADALQNMDPTSLATIVAFGTANADKFDGDGVTTQFVLSDDPGALNNLDVSIGGVTQTPGIDYAWSAGTTITFTSAPPVGTDNVLVRYMQGLPQGQTAANLVTLVDSSDFFPATVSNVEQALAQLGSAARLSVKDPRFGAVGDGVTDDTAAIVAAVAACQAASQTSLFFPAGIYRVASTITLGAGGTRGIAFIGETATAQQGSDRPPVTIRWHGGAAAMFDVQSTYFSFYNVAFENFTTATDVFLLTAAMHMVLDNCSFVLGSGTTRFSRSVMHADGNEFGYSVVKDCTIQNPAPRFLDIDGLGTGNGITPVLFENNVIESNSGGAHTVVYIKDEGMDALTFRANTFNGQANAQLTVVDTTDTPISETIAVLNFYDNEIDLVANTATDRCFRLTNVTNVNFWGNQVQGGGTVTAIGNLVNSTVTLFTGNNGSSIGGPFWSCDATSRVYPGVNKFNNANTNGVGSDPGTGKAGGVLQVVTATYSTQTSLGAAYADLVSATITPLSKTSKILVIANVNGLAVTGTTTSIQARINRGATVLLDIEKEAGYAGAVTTELAIGGIGATYMDAPSSTSALTYKIQIQKTGGSSGVANTSGGSSTITVMELAA